MNLDCRIFEQILDEQICCFQNNIIHECREDSRKLHPIEKDFQIFKPASDEYFKYKYFEGMLERYLREDLTIQLFYRWFEKIDIVCELKENNRNMAKFVCSNETNERRNPILFVVKDGKQSVGYRYTEPDVSLWKIRRWLMSYKINHIVVIDWQDRTSFSGVDDEKDLVRHVSLKRFISTYFSEEIYDTYIKKIRCVVEEANKVIGFQTIEHLSLKQLSFLKEDVLRYLLDFKFRIEQYQEFNDEGKMTGVLYDLLSDEDYDIIQKNCLIRDYTKLW